MILYFKTISNNYEKYQEYSQKSLGLKQQHEGCHHSANRETNYESCPLTSTYILCHVCAQTHAYTHTYTQMQ